MFDKIKSLFKKNEPKPFPSWAEPSPAEPPKVEVAPEPPKVEVAPAPVEAEAPAPKPAAKKKRATKPKAKAKAKDPSSPKEIATAAGEPYIAILSMTVDPDNINNGSFELDWNDKFVLNLIRAGYKLREDDKDADIVDRWFQTICRNIALEFYEQDQADPVNRTINEMLMIRSRDLGGGRTEVS